jgi:hypothetical protein
VDFTRPSPIPSSCGGCTVCCKVLQVNDTPGGPKPAGVACPYLNAEDSGCTIYETRPATCKSFECMYIKLARRSDVETPETLRPDKSGVMIVHNPQRLYFTCHVYDPARPEAWRAPEVQEVILRLLEEGFKVIISWGTTANKTLLESDGKGGYTREDITMNPPNAEGEQHGKLQ